ncbi:MAG TPA: DNA recombination protein RmuC [Candidatus Margulisiibacteriota bacterium]|nr:DNA recombination protein RmuC [Candidatus Margulisiibacteriota bacterium]
MTLAVALGVALAVVAVLLVLLVLVLLNQRQTAARVEALSAAQEADRSPLLLQQQIEGLRDQFGRALEANTHALNQQLAHIATTVHERLHENVELMQHTHRTLGERLDSTAQVIGAVHRSLGSLEEANRKIYEIGKDISSLQQILQAPKLRGGLGELLLEDLLKQILPADHFVVQHGFRSGQKVDAVIRLGSGLVPVDAKFPLENFRRLLDAQTDDERSRVRRAFVTDVKRHIDAVATKYILPDEGTFDFALMYIPAENVYYEIVVKDEATGDADISAYALSRKVIPVSPGSFYAYLQAIVLGLRGLRIEERSQEILQQLARLRGDFDRFRDDFRLVGKHLNNAISSFAGADRRLERLETRFASVVGTDEVESGEADTGQISPLFPPKLDAANKSR